MRLLLAISTLSVLLLKPTSASMKCSDKSPTLLFSEKSLVKREVCEKLKPANLFDLDGTLLNPNSCGFLIDQNDQTGAAPLVAFIYQQCKCLNISANATWNHVRFEPHSQDKSLMVAKCNSIRLAATNIRCDGLISEIVNRAFQQSRKECGVKFRYEAWEKGTQGPTENIDYCYDKFKPVPLLTMLANVLRNDENQFRINVADMELKTDGKKASFRDSLNGATCNSNGDGLLVSSYCTDGPIRDTWVTFSNGVDLTGQSEEMKQLNEMLKEFKMLDGSPPLKALQDCQRNPN